jgi:hypothetical protein
MAEMSVTIIKARDVLVGDLVMVCGEFDEVSATARADNAMLITTVCGKIKLAKPDSFIPVGRRER